MKNYEQAREELSQFEEALNKAEALGMKVEWFCAFKEAIRGHALIGGLDDFALEHAINSANKKLGM